MSKSAAFCVPNMVGSNAVKSNIASPSFVSSSQIITGGTGFAVGCSSTTRTISIVSKHTALRLLTIRAKILPEVAL